MLTENHNPSIIEHIAILLCFAVHIKQEDIIPIFKDIMNTEYRHYILMFLLYILEGTSNVEIKVNLLNKDLGSKKRLEPVYDYFCKIQPSPLSMLAQQYMKYIVDEDLFSQDSDLDSIAMGEIDFIRDRLFAGAIFLLGVLIIYKLFIDSSKFKQNGYFSRF